MVGVAVRTCRMTNVVTRAIGTGGSSGESLEASGSPEPPASGASNASLPHPAPSAIAHARIARTAVRDCQSVVTVVHPCGDSPLSTFVTCTTPTAILEHRFAAARDPQRRYVGILTAGRAPG